MCTEQAYQPRGGILPASDRQAGQGYWRAARRERHHRDRRAERVFADEFQPDVAGPVLPRPFTPPAARTLGRTDPTHRSAEPVREILDMVLPNRRRLTGQHPDQDAVGGLGALDADDGGEIFAGVAVA